MGAVAPSFLASQPQSIRVVLQDMTDHGVNPSDVLGQMKAPEALAMAQAIVQSGMAVEVRPLDPSG